MNRYRSYAPTDDLPITDGDDSLVGVNEWDTGENIPPGQVQSAVNIDFTTQDAVTRGGFVCIPELGLEPYGDFWTVEPTSSAYELRASAFGNATFVIVGSQAPGNDVITSRDGITWVERTSAADRIWLGVCFGNGLFVAVASNGATTSNVMTSPDGATWTLRTGLANNWKSVCRGDDKFVAVSSDGTTRVMWSSDGITWSNAGVTGTGNGAWNSVTFADGLFVAVAPTGTDQVITSPDGLTWTARTAATTNQWNAVTYGNGLFVAVAGTGTGDRVMTSPDGITWTSRTSAADIVWTCVTFGNGTFVAGGTTAPSVMTSSNGIDWVTRSSASVTNLSTVVYGSNLFIAAAVSGVGANNVMRTSTQTVFARGLYSDPDDPGSQWIMLVTQTKVGFFAFGRTSREISYTSSETVTEQATVVQANNAVYIFRGFDETPLYWDGSWAGEFTVAPTPSPSAGFTIIPNSNQATYCQNRLWAIRDKDIIGASDVLDFTAWDELANEFNLNTGDSNYLVTTYPFGTTTLLVFKNRSIVALTNVEGALGDVVATEITRQVGAIGINSVVSVGPDVVYMSDRNINLVTLTSTNNSLQHKTLPLSRNIQKIFKRVNWNVASKVSLGYNDNKLYVALPLDNSTVCNAVCVYNFVTEQWFGEWNFDASMGMAIQGWQVANYLGSQRMHCITEDGRIFVTDEGPQDISGTNVSEISTSLTTRAYRMNNDNRVNRRMWADLSTWRPNFSVTAYVDGASESSALISGQTYARSQSWIFNDSTYSLTNSGDDYNREGRKDYAGYCSDSIQAQSGFLPQQNQDYRLPLLFRRKGRLVWFNVTNTQGQISINGIGGEARAGDRSNLTQVI